MSTANKRGPSKEKMTREMMMSQAKSRNNMPLAFSIAAEILAFDSKGEK
jgi:hypothetical protein